MTSTFRAQQAPELPQDGAGRRDGIDDVATARRGRHPLYLLGTLAVLVLGAQIVWFLLTNPRLEWDVVWEYLFSGPILDGVRLTLILTVVGMVVGTVIGVFVGLARMSTYPPLRWGAVLYSRFFLGVPVLVQLIFWYNLGFLTPEVSLGIPFGPTFVSWETNALITSFVAATLGLGLHEGAYMAEVIRAGLLSVDSGQRDAADALGLTPGQRFRRILLPQAMRFIIPPTANQVTLMLKGTALVSVIAMGELLHSVQAVYDRTFQVVPLLLVACVWYLGLISLLEVVQRWLERKYSRGFGASTNGAKARRRKLLTLRGAEL